MVCLKILAIMGLGIATATSTEGSTYGLLSVTRPKITFVPLTTEQRKDVADTINSLMSVFVNREQKISYYGREKVDIDPVPRVQALSKKVANMTDEEMHYAYSKVFLSLRDKHTSYYFPSPHRCYTAVTAAEFTFARRLEVTGDDGPPKVVVSGLSSTKEILALSPNATNISVGDELLTIDGITFEEYYQQNKFNFNGANEWGGKRVMLKTLASRPGESYPMPEKDEVVYVLKSFKTGNNYTISLPWITSSLNDCQSNYQKLRPSLNSTSPEVVPPEQIYKTHLSKREADNDQFKLNPTESPTIFWGIWKPKSKNLAIIVCKSFKAPITIKITLLAIRSLLQNELRNTSALLWDIRSNDGGYVHLAEIIPQLFQSDIIPSSRRAIVAPPNEYIFLKSYHANDPWHQAYLKVKSNDTYTPWTRITSIESANMFGVSYIKPVGVLTDGACYSACELLAASMKDNNAATIFGEDATTGGVGANANHNYMLVPLNPRDFKRMPFTKELGDYAHDASVSWRQTFRVKAKEGVPIEDYGIESDYRILPTELDLMPNTTQNSQYDRIADILIQNGIASRRNNMYFQATPALETESPMGSNVTFHFEIEGLQKIQVLDSANQVVASLNIDLDVVDTRQQKSIQFVPNTTKPVTERFEIKAFDTEGNQVLTTYRFVSFPVQPQYFATVTAQPTELHGNASYVGIYERGLTRNGWQIQGSKYFIPAGFDSNLDSSLVFFFNAVSKPVTLKVKGRCHTLVADYLQILIKDSNKQTNRLDYFSYELSIDKTYTFTPQGDFRLELWFTSVGASGKDGVHFDSITVTLE